MLNSTVMTRRLAALALLLTLAAIGVTSGVMSPVHSSRRPSPNVVEGDIKEAYGRLPLTFEANQGQTDPRVKFFSRGNGYSLFLTSTEAILTLTARRPGDTQRRGDGRDGGLERLLPASRSASHTMLRMTLVGANPAPRVAASDDLPGKTHYFAGRDPRQWRNDIPTYATVRYATVYPGVDLVYYGNRRQLEYDFIVAPGADPGRIKLRFEGAREVVIDQDGDLVLRVAESEIRQHKPVIYQEVDGARREVDGHYVMIGTDQIGFEVAGYDVSRPLVIDPVLIYSTYLGGSVIDAGQGLAVASDSAGYAYIAGLTNSLDFPTTPGTFQPAYAGGIDAFVTKLNRNGSALVYSTYLGGSSLDFASGIAVDALGQAYITGGTNSVDFPTTVGAFQPASAGNVDAFVTKLNRRGSGLVFSTYLGGTGAENFVLGLGGIALDSSGQAYVTGTTESRDFPTTPHAFQPANGGSLDAYVTKVNRRGSALVYSTYLGGAGVEAGEGIALRRNDDDDDDDDDDTAGSAYVTGFTDSPDFPTTPGAFQPVMGGGLADAFVTEVNRHGSALAYSTYLGGSGFDFGLGIAVDQSAHAFVTGGTDSLDFPTTRGAFQLTNGGGIDGFVTKVNRRGSALRYSTYLGGSGQENFVLIAAAIAVDDAGQAYVTGVTGSPDFPTTQEAVQPATGGGNDAFVTKLNRSGSALRYSTYLGGTTDDFGAGVALDRDDDDDEHDSGVVYVTGASNSPNFPTTPRAFQPANAGDFDAFVTKLATGRGSDDHGDGDDGGDRDGDRNDEQRDDDD